MSNITIEVNKSIELVQVLIYLANRQERTFQVIDNIDYIPNIQSYFEKFKEHEAVKITTELIDNSDKINFIHIEPLKAILNINDINNDNAHPLHNWAHAVIQFEKETDFNSFFNSNYDYYKMIVDKIKSFNVDKWVEFTERYFKRSFDDFNLILCPFAGNYGFVMDVPKKDTAYTVRCEPYYDKSGNMLWYPAYFARGVAHEFAHCFVNPAVKNHKDILSNQEMDSFFNAHNNIPSFYNVRYAVINEYFVRAFAIKFMRNFKYEFEYFDMQQEINRQREMFIFIDKFIELLNEYEKSNLTFENYYLSVLSKIGNMAN